MKYQQVSFIENLPELEQVENFPMTERSPKLTSIRNRNESLSNESGMKMQLNGNMNSAMMNPMNTPLNTPMMSGPMNSGEQVQFQATDYLHQPYYSNAPYGGPYGGGSPGKSDEIIENLEMPYISPSSIDCRQVFDHISKCPICAKFYKHDNTIYIIVITILIIACALLLKRVLKV